MEKTEKNANDQKLIQSQPGELVAIPSDISVSVNSKDGQQKEYTFPETVPSNIMVLKSSASTAADIGIQVIQPWQDKIREEIDDIKKLHIEEVELNFGLIKVKLKRS